MQNTDLPRGGGNVGAFLKKAALLHIATSQMVGKYVLIFVMQKSGS